MAEFESKPAGVFTLFQRTARTVVAALQNRGELFLVELELEKARVIELLIWTAIAGFLGMMFVVVLTAAVIFLCPEVWRVYATAGFCVFYLLATILAFMNLRALWRSTPGAFSETVAQAKKDTEWLESLK